MNHDKAFDRENMVRFGIGENIYTLIYVIYAIYFSYNDYFAISTPLERWQLLATIICLSCCFLM